MVWVSLIATLVLLVWMMMTTKTSLVPQEDQGAIMVNMSIAPGSTLEENKLIMAKIEKSWKVRQRSSIMPALPVMGLSPDKEPLTVRLSSD